MKKILLGLFLLLLTTSSYAADANHKEVDITTVSEKCETECHTSENVAQAQADKVTVDVCKDCHVGPEGEDLYEEQYNNLVAQAQEDVKEKKIQGDVKEEKTKEQQVLDFAKEANHKEVDITTVSEKCETECHTPENVAQAQENKVTIDVCKDCHVGPEGEDLYEEQYNNLVAQAQEDAKEKKIKEQKSSKYDRMVLIPAGSFVMGTNERWDDEGPQYTAFLEDYYIDLYELSNAEYLKFINNFGHRVPAYWNKKTGYPEGKGNHPVVYINWEDANAYCKWVGKRLPTQEEWEKAARGTDGRTYPWGNDFDPNRSNNPIKKSTGTEPIDFYENGKSPYGLYNMSGNVWEWTSSWYKAYPGSNHPRDTYGEKLKVLKGGSWYNCMSYDCGISAPVYNRAPFEPDVKGNSFGFRCAKGL